MAGAPLPAAAADWPECEAAEARLPAFGDPSPALPRAGESSGGASPPQADHTALDTPSASSRGRPVSAAAPAASVSDATAGAAGPSAAQLAASEPRALRTEPKPDAWLKEDEARPARSGVLGGEMLGAAGDAVDPAADGPASRGERAAPPSENDDAAMQASARPLAGGKDASAPPALPAEATSGDTAASAAAVKACDEASGAGHAACQGGRRVAVADASQAARRPPALL